MNKLLMVTTVPVVLTNFLLPFAAHFRALGWQVDAMSCGFAPDDVCFSAFDRLWEVEWSRNPLDPRNLLGTPGIISKIVARERYDIVHVHTPVAAFVTRYALKDVRTQLRSKIIYTAHGFHFYAGQNPVKNFMFLALEKLASHWTDYLVTINLQDEATVARHQLIPPEYSCNMPGIGIDLDYYHPQLVTAEDVARVRAELGLKPGTPLLLSVADFTPNKRNRDTISALAKLARPDVHLAIAGTGTVMAQAQQLAIDLGIANRVHFLGRRNDVRVLMRAASANILVSGREGMPRSVMESLALAVPTIGTKVRGTQDLLAGGYGLLVDVGDVQGLTDAIVQILDQPEAANRMAQRGREHLSAYDLKEIIRLHEELYAQAIALINDN